MDDYIVAVYKAYRAAIAGLGGHYNRPIASDIKHWTKTANLCRRIKADPVRFVNVQFSALDETRKKTLTPEMLHKPVGRVLRVYNATAVTPLDISKAAGLMKTRLARELSAGRRLTEIMEDPDTGFAAWFRFAYTDQVTPVLRACYYEEASEELKDDDITAFLRKEGRYDTLKRHFALPG